MHFRITGLDPSPFLPLYGLSDEELMQRGVQRITIRAAHAAPDRIELRDAEPGENVLLLNHAYLDLGSPYDGRHAIFVREGATERYDECDRVPDAMRRRLMSVRAFDAAGTMLDADVVDGRDIESLIERLLANPAAAFLQAHHAKRGCYAARIERAG